MANFMREELSLKTLTEVLKFESFPNPLAELINR